MKLKDLITDDEGKHIYLTNIISINHPRQDTIKSMCDSLQIEEKNTVNVLFTIDSVYDDGEHVLIVDDENRFIFSSESVFIWADDLIATLSIEKNTFKKKRRSWLDVI